MRLLPIAPPLVAAALLCAATACAGSAEQRPGAVLMPTYAGPDAARDKITVRLVLVAAGFDQPTDIQAVPGQPGRLVVLEKTGAAKWVDVASGEGGVWFRDAVLTRSEQGLLGLAFHPKFAENGRFFVDSTVESGGKATTRVAEWAVEPKEPLAETKPRFVRAVIEVAQPYANHNAGQIAFGPDGKLYVALGDGGAANDPQGNGQDLSTLLGAMLRLDVDGTAPYAIPPDNPFVGRAGARGEIWAYGLRNPWRFAFAPDGRMVVGDVGQNAFEEITIVGRGENHGWNTREAGHCFPSGEKCLGGAFVDPIWEYPRAEGISVTGGYVYTGKAVPALAGHYVFADYGSRRFWAMRLPADKALQPESAVRALGQFDVTPTTFGRGHDGEMYVADFAHGRIYRFSDD